MNWIKTHWIIKKIFSNYVWDIPNSENKIYLTFDDGPTPEITQWTLNQLKNHKAKATFFCIGDNIKKYPEIYETVLKEGHSVGNHTFNHLNGWKTKNSTYLENVEKHKKLEERSNNQQLATERLFRPPYGKIKPSQSKKLRKLGYKIIMWDCISYDFDSTISKEKCLENVVNNTQSGSIVVFHDSQKAFANLEYVLPKALDYFSKKGFVFEVLK